MSNRQDDADLDEELRFHLEMQQKKNEQTGMTPEEARRSASIRVGGMQQIKEEVREQRAGFWLETLWKDAAYGARMLWRTRGLTALCLITLAVAIGTCTAMYSAVNATMLRPLPYYQSGNLVDIVDVNQEKGIDRTGVNARNLEDWRNASTAFEGMTAFYTTGRTLSSESESEVVMASLVSEDFFHVFLTRPLLGRVFTREESQRARSNNTLGLMDPDPVCVLSANLWKRRYGSDPHIIGKTITIDRISWEVIGVMSPEFVMPEAGTALWIPWGFRFDYARDQHFAGAVARLKPGTSLPEAQDQLNAVAAQLALQFPESNRGWSVRLHPLRQSVIRDYEQILWFLLAAVGIVMLIACLNIAILQLSRASARTQESAVRLALGASRGRLIRQFLVESMMLAMAGGASGFAIAYVLIAALPKYVPDLPRVSEIQLDGQALLCGFVVTLLAAVIFGLAPAFLSTRGSLLLWKTSRVTAGASAQRLRNVLVIAEVALAVTLLSSSAMLMRSLQRLQNVDPGFQAERVLVFPVFLDSARYDSDSKTRGYYKDLIENLQQLPAVESVGGATALPASPVGPDFERPVWSRESGPREENKRLADVRMVTPDYFRVMGISLKAGREYGSQDTPDSNLVVIINESLSRLIWHGANPVGKQLVVDSSKSGPDPYEVVGVVSDLHFYGPRQTPRPEIYFPHAQRSYLILNMAIRTKNDPRLLIASVREVMQRIDPQKPALSITPLEDLIGRTLRQDRYAMGIVAIFAAVAVFLAGLGVYGVLAFFVRQKVQEIGVRSALGAKQGQIVSWIAAQALRLLLIGLAGGIVLTVAFSQLLAGILFEVSTRDPLSLIAAACIVLFAAILAGWIPALRASRIEPSVALRYE